MADTTALKNRIKAAIKANSNQEITGPVLQQALLDMVDELNGGTVVINGNVTNLPDEEDLTSVKKSEHNVLRLADRNYAPYNFSGKGYKILRKNIVDGKNVLTQNMINKPNTIYDIRYDFDLNGQEITIPEGCILDFQGGHISNFSSINNFNQNSINPDWFLGNDTEKLQQAINLAKNNYKEVIIQRNYTIDNTIILYSNISIVGKFLCDAINDIPTIKYIGNDYLFDFIIKDDSYYTNISFKDLIIGGNKANDGLKLYATRSQLINVTFKDFNIALTIKPTIMSLVECNIYNCNFDGNNYGIKQITNNSHGATDGNIVNCRFSRSTYTDIIMETCYNWTIIGNRFYGKYINGSPVLDLYGFNSRIDNNTFDQADIIINLGSNSLGGFTITNNFVHFNKKQKNYFINITKGAFAKSIISNNISLNTGSNVESCIIKSSSVSLCRVQLYCNIGFTTYYDKNNLDCDVFSFDYYPKFSRDRIFLKDNKIIISYNDTLPNTNDLRTGDFLINTKDAKASIFIGNNKWRTLPISYGTGYKIPDTISKKGIIKVLQDLVSSLVSGGTMFNNDNAWPGIEANPDFGNSMSRPTLNENNIGFEYFDTTLNKPIYWTGSKWVGSDGNDIR